MTASFLYVNVTFVPMTASFIHIAAASVPMTSSFLYMNDAVRGKEATSI
jgi:hypothetical protein